MRGQGHAVPVEVEGEALFAVADTRGHALGVRAASGTVWDTVVGGVGGEAWTAVADTWGDALAVRTPSGTLWDAFSSGIESEALFAVADAWSHALAVRTTLGARWRAPAGRVEGEALFAGADAWRNAVATDASAGAAGHAGLCVTLGVGVPLATGAHSRGGALPVATVLADRHALLRFDVGAFRRGLKGEPSLAPADTWGDAVTVLAATRADGLALSGQLVGVVAQLAGAHIWREAVRILLALVLAVGHADTFQRDPAWWTGAHVRRGAFSAQASLQATWIAGSRGRVPLVAVAAGQNCDLSVRRPFLGGGGKSVARELARGVQCQCICVR